MKCVYFLTVQHSLFPFSLDKKEAIFIIFPDTVFSHFIFSFLHSIHILDSNLMYANSLYCLTVIYFSALFFLCYNERCRICCT